MCMWPPCSSTRREAFLWTWRLMMQHICPTRLLSNGIISGMEVRALYLGCSWPRYCRAVVAHTYCIVCIEPNPAYWRRLAYRRCQVIGAVVGQTPNEEIKFHIGSDGAMGGILKEGFDNDPSGNIDHTKVSFYYTVTLTQVLDRLSAPSVIDYFCLDVEGPYDRVGSLRTMNALPYFRVLGPVCCCRCGVLCASRLCIRSIHLQNPDGGATKDGSRRLADKKGIQAAMHNISIWRNALGFGET
jgi:hypothetical protein